MPPTSRTVRVDGSFYEAAERTAKACNRSTSAQIQHWARLGEAVEASNIGAQTIISLLDGRSYYDLSREDQSRANLLLWEELGKLDGGLDPELVAESKAIDE